MFFQFISALAPVSAALFATLALARPRYVKRWLHVNAFMRNYPLSSVVMCVGIALSALDFGLALPGRMSADLGLALLPVAVIPAGAGRVDRRRFCIFALALEAVSLVCTILYSTGYLTDSAPYLHPLSVSICAAVSFIAMLFAGGNSIRPEDDRFTPLSVSGILSDVIYLCGVCLLLAVSAMSCWISTLPAAASVSRGVDALCSLLMAFMLGCCLLRRTGNRHFLFFGQLEQRLSRAVQECMSDRSITADRKDNLYRNVFCRVEEYFRLERPFLDVDINIADVSERVFTNRAYVSRAISEFSGSNFRQYVNGYRIRYSMDCYRRNPSLKVSDLSSMSGFRTVASYNTAFRRIVGEVPTHWMRRTCGIIRKGGPRLLAAGLRAG